MSSFLSHRRKAFRAPAGGGGGFTAPPNEILSANPIHWWDLADAGVWEDSAGGWTFDTEHGTPVVDAGEGPNGQAVMDAALADSISRSGVDWDGRNEYRMSAAIWVRGRALAGDWLGLRGAGYLFQFFFTATSQMWSVAQEESGSYISLFPNFGMNEMVLNQWHHFVVTYNHEGQHKLYMDGSLIQTANASANATLPTTGNLTVAIGAQAGGPDTQGTQSDGHFAMAGYWDEALTLADVGLLYNSGNGRQWAEI